MRKQTLVSSLTTRFIFKELALGRMPMCTSRSRTGTSQIISARLSKNGKMVTFASDASFLNKLRPRDIDGSGSVAAVSFCFLRTVVTLMPETALVSLRTLAFFFPLVTETFFPHATPNNPFRLLTTAPDSRLPCLASKFRTQSF